MTKKIDFAAIAARIDLKIRELQEDEPKIKHPEIGRRIGEMLGQPAITSESIRVWRTGKAMPSLDKLEALADYLQVPVEWFLFGWSIEEEMRKLKSRVCVSDHEYELIMLFRSIGPEHQPNLIEMVKLWVRTLPPPSNVIPLQLDK